MSKTGKVKKYSAGRRQGLQPTHISTFMQANRTLMQTLSDYLDTVEAAWGTAAQIAGLL
jgi:phosphosulfolactate synthase (CoM biosynthesis protein A)